MSASMFLPIAVALLCGGVIPSLVDLVTKWDAPNWLKAWIAAILSALAGSLATVSFDPSTGWAGYVTAVGAAFVASFSAYQAGTSQPVKWGTASFGIRARKHVTTGKGDS